MPLFDHLGELRRRLTVIVVTLLIAACALYLFSGQIILFLVQPIATYLSSQPITALEDLPSVLNILDPLGGFTLKFKVSVVFAAIVTSPIWLWQIMGFFLPALTPKERGWVIPTFLAGVFLFILGTIFCYSIILRPAFQWMLEQTIDYANVFANAPEYINLILLFEIGFGIAFELPIAVFYLIVFNVVPYKKLRGSWRTVYVVLMLISAVVTPDASPVTMLLMFAAMAALYEGSLLVSRIVLHKRIKAQNAAGQAGDDDDED
ncbi:MAG: twin-arginine translocase subunit TatC [Coriobacteriales bacterium]|jgi:sec-independent protein translocase protein TatC|nr:twin-arginine translocase subunit TatC [Coriobacteriales bacterium]